VDETSASRYRPQHHWKPVASAQPRPQQPPLSATSLLVGKPDQLLVTPSPSLSPSVSHTHTLLTTHTHTHSLDNTHSLSTTH
jgi:hypothetical protein